ncbi:MAG: putative aliphatic sulfonates transport permease protein SsuC [Planctomycetota bacterium]
MSRSPSPASATVPRTGSPADLLLPLTVLALLLVTWQTAVWFFQVSPVLFPSPLLVLQAGWKIRWQLSEAALRTAAAAGTGLALGTATGTLTAFAFSQSGAIRRAFYPYAVLLQTVPIIAIAPVVIVTLGRGFSSVALVAAILSLFPIITNTTTGLLQVSADLQDLFRLNQATRWQTLIHLRVPAALPYLLSGIRISSGSAIVGAIVGEFFVGSGNPGLGALIQRKSASLVLSELYAVVLISTLLGTVSFGGISAAGEFVLRRWFGMSLSETRR